MSVLANLYSHYNIIADNMAVDLIFEVDDEVIDYNNIFIETADGRIWTDVDKVGHVLWYMGKTVNVYATVPMDKRPIGAFTVTVSADGAEIFSTTLNAEADISLGWRTEVLSITPPRDRHEMPAIYAAEHIPFECP